METPVLLATRFVCAFVAVVALLLSVLPRPWTPVDYLIAGVAGTMAGLGWLFGRLAGDAALPFRRRSNREG